jgi:hypothetical protein
LPFVVAPLPLCRRQSDTKHDLNIFIYT